METLKITAKAMKSLTAYATKGYESSYKKEVGGFLKIRRIKVAGV
jgi:hypothetical protein